MSGDEVEDDDEEDEGKLMRNASKYTKKNYFIVFDY